MNVAIQDHVFGLNPAGRAYAIDRMTHALDSVREHVRRVTVSLLTREGNDKVCRVAVDLNVGRAVVVERCGATLTGVVEGAAHKAGEVVCAELDRRNDRQRTGRLVRALKTMKRLLGRKGDLP